MAGGQSFAGTLTNWLRKLDPKRILEWGPGYSTRLMYKYTDADITTIENQKVYFDMWAKVFQGKVRLLFEPAPEENRKAPEWDSYCNPPVQGKFDLIFVDGRERVRCLEFARKHVTQNGVVILHDAERPEYQEGKKGFKVIEEVSGTCVLKLP